MFTRKAISSLHVWGVVGALRADGVYDVDDVGSDDGG